VVIANPNLNTDVAQDHKINGKDTMETNVVKIPHMVVVVMVLKPELMKLVLTVLPLMPYLILVACTSTDVVKMEQLKNLIMKELTVTVPNNHTVVAKIVKSLK